MKKPLVSIIINNYNYGRFLKECIDSALGQTYESIEVIVVDDGSTDNSNEIINAYGTKIISVFKENGGQASAYNAGFAISHGDFICNFDSDDTLMPIAIEKAIEKFDSDTVKVQWPLLIIEKDSKSTGEITTKWTPPEGNLRNIILKNGPFYDFYLTTGGLVKRSFLESVLPMPEEQYKIGSDEYLLTLVPLFGRIKNIGHPLGTYRSHGTNHYMGTKIDENKIQSYISRFETSCDMLEIFAKKLGFEVHPESWKKNNFTYIWPTRLIQARKVILKLIPPTTTYILLDQNECGNYFNEPNYTIRYFLDKDGIFNGLPKDDQAAIKELERLKSEGSTFLIVWWTSYWIFQHYPKFNNYLRITYKCIFSSEAITVFDISLKLINIQ